jgi:release factor glutamine methyltransferase
LKRSSVSGGYQPSDDTYLILDSLEEYRGESALEIGVGSGIILKQLRKSFSLVIGTDIDLENLLLCNRSNNMEANLICCDGVSALASSQKYDLIVSNPPYLPFEENDSYDSTIHGGIIGSDKALEFIESAIYLLNQHGTILILLSSLSNLPYFDTKVKSLGLSRRTISKKKLFFESLSVEEIRIRNTG